MMKDTKTFRLSGIAISTVILLIISILAIVGISIFMSVEFTSTDVSIGIDDVSYFNSGWRLISNGKSKVIIPSDIKRTDFDSSNTIRISNVIPADSQRKTAICFQTCSGTVNVTLDGTCIYEYGETSALPFGNSFGSVLHIIDLPIDSANKNIVIEYVSSSERLTGYGINFVYGYHNSVVFYLLKKALPPICLCTLLYMIGAFLLIYGFFGRKRHYDRKDMLLGLYLFFCATFVLCDSQALQLLLENKAAIYFIQLSSFYLLPVPLLLYFGHIFENYSKAFYWLSLIITTNYTVRTVLYITDTLDFGRYIDIFRCALAIPIFFIIFACYKYRKSTKYRLFTIGILILAISCVFSFLAFIFIDSDIYISIFFTGNIIVSVMWFRNSISRNLMDIAKLQTTLKTDLKTGVYNKLSTETEINAALNTPHEGTDVLAVIDIDNLKTINDSLGHIQGDRAIQEFAKTLQTHFPHSDDIIGRIGGDEFMVFYSCPTSEARIRDSLQTLSKHLAVIKIGTDDKYSIHGSIGVCIKPAYEKMSFDQLYENADKALYHVKTGGKNGVFFFHDLPKNE